MDADFSHDPKYLPQLPDRRSQDADLVLGSRYLHGGQRHQLADRAGCSCRYGANLYARWITGLPLTDATGGFKCFRREVLEAT